MSPSPPAPQPPISLAPYPRISCYPGPVLPDSLNELTAVAQNLGANILEIPEGTPVILELAGPATIILAQPAEFETGGWNAEKTQ